MPITAVFEKHAARNTIKNPLGTAVTKAVSPGAGVVPTAKTGDSSAGAYSPASVLGTGMNADTLVNTVEAV